MRYPASAEVVAQVRESKDVVTDLMMALSKSVEEAKAERRRAKEAEVESRPEMSAAEVFETHEPNPVNIVDGDALAAMRDAVRRRAKAEEDVSAAVDQARSEGHAWAAIGAILGTTGEAARQRYKDRSLARAAVPRDARSWVGRSGG